MVSLGHNVLINALNNKPKLDNNSHCVKINTLVNLNKVSDPNLEAMHC